MTEDSSWGLGWWCWEAVSLASPASKPHTTDPVEWAIDPSVASPEGRLPPALPDPILEAPLAPRPEAADPSPEVPERTDKER